MDTYSHTEAFTEKRATEPTDSPRLLKSQRNYWRNLAQQRYRQNYGLWLAVALLSVLLLFTSIEAYGREYAHDADLIRIIDGDTYVMRLHIYHGSQTRQHVRLADWDTPEFRGKCQREKDLALKAAIFAGLWFERAGGTVRATSTKQDSFGRPLSALVSAEGSLGLALRDAGLARPFKRGRNEGWCDG